MRFALYLKELRLLRFSIVISLSMLIVLFSFITWTIPTSASLQFQFMFLYFLFMTAPLFLIQSLRYEHKRKTIALWKMTPLALWQLLAIKISAALTATALLMSCGYVYITLVLSYKRSVPLAYLIHDSAFIIDLLFAAWHITCCALFTYALVRRLKYGTTLAGLLIFSLISSSDWLLSKWYIGKQLITFMPYRLLYIDRVIQNHGITDNLTGGYLLYTCLLTIPTFMLAVYAYNKSLERSL